MSTIHDNTLGMFILRAWLWLVPIGMFIAALVFGAWAAIDGRWGLFGFMVFIEFTAIMLLIFHWWILYRFGKEPSS
jgi:hypothetical protein